MNKKIISLILITALTVPMEAALNVSSVAEASEPVQMEYLDRGTTAVKSGSGVYLS